MVSLLGLSSLEATGGQGLGGGFTGAETTDRERCREGNCIGATEMVAEVARVVGLRGGGRGPGTGAEFSSVFVDGEEEKAPERRGATGRRGGKATTGTPPLEGIGTGTAAGRSGACGVYAAGLSILK